MALIVITGAARSGKSAAAERFVRSRASAGHDCVVAVFGRGEGDPEMATRIERHRAGRPPGVRTVEAADPRSWRDAVPDGATLLVECLGTLAALFLDDVTERAEASAQPSTLADMLDAELADTVAWLVRRGGDTVVVTNETGWGVVPAYESGRVFRDALGRVNADLVRLADAAYLAVDGRMIDLTSLPHDISWPSD